MSTIPAPPRTGLVPAITGLFSAVSRPASRLNLDRFAIGLVFFAGVVTILKKNGVEVPQFMVLFGCSLGIAGLLYEMSASRAMIRAFWDAKPFLMFCNFAIWGAAFSFSVFNWIGAAADGQAEKTNFQKAAYMHSADARTGLDMAEQALKEARAKAKQLHDAAWETIPTVAGQKITDRGQADAALAKVKSNTRYWDLTNGCTETKGPKTRAYCADFNDAKAAIAWSDTHPALLQNASDADKEVSRLEHELTDARKVASNTTIVTSEDRADLFLLTDFAGMSDKHAAQAAGFISVLVISIFLSLGSMREEVGLLSKIGPRRKWSFFSRAYRRVYRAVWGHEPDNTTYVTNFLDPRGAEALSAHERFVSKVASHADAARQMLNPNEGAFA